MLHSIEYYDQEKSLLGEKAVDVSMFRLLLNIPHVYLIPK